METFNDDIARLRRYIASKKAERREVRSFELEGSKERTRDFRATAGSTIVLKEDMRLELGGPDTTATAFALVTNRAELIRDGAVTLIGPDVPEATGTRPFAQVLLIASPELHAEDYRRINSLQYGLELRGYMIKTVPSSLTIWSRVNKECARDGFCFGVLAEALRDSYRSTFDGAAVETIFVTSSEGDVGELEDLRDKVARIIGAMNKMESELAFDCSACEYLDICSDVRQLGKLRKRLMNDRRRGASAPPESGSGTTTGQ